MHLAASARDSVAASVCVGLRQFIIIEVGFIYCGFFGPWSRNDEAAFMAVLILALLGGEHLVFEPFAENCLVRAMSFGSFSAPWATLILSTSATM
jgi:hypothetical protein